MSNAQRHNLSVAWVRMWGALGAQVAADNATETAQALARELAAFEARRLATACYALETTTSIYV